MLLALTLLKHFPAHLATAIHDTDLSIITRRVPLLVNLSTWFKIFALSPRVAEVDVVDILVAEALAFSAAVVVSLVCLGCAVVRAVLRIVALIFGLTTPSLALFVCPTLQERSVLVC
jgi:hypothetical protein